ncbi:MAG: hypothetical protein GY906_07525 [bacterium]|nr:hypothetical protein [bacterium]
MTLHPPPFPDRLRHRLDPPRPRLRVILSALLPGLLLLLPLWRVHSVEVISCQGLPESAVASCLTMIDTPVILLNLDYFRRQTDTWPGVRSADVAFDLGGTLTVKAHPAAAQASTAVANSWHGVTKDGYLSGRLDGPKAPVLYGFAHDPDKLKTALAIVRRVETAFGANAISARPLLPGSLELELQLPSESDHKILARVGREATASEVWWCQQMNRGDGPWSHVDLLYEDRVIIGGAL